MGSACEIKTSRTLKSIYDPMTPKATQEELQAASYASLRAHATSAPAQALVSTLGGMLDNHTLATGARKNKRKSTAEKLDYAVGAFLADLLRGKRTVPVPKKAGAHEYLTKPLDVHSFLQAIAATVGSVEPYPGGEPSTLSSDRSR